MVLFQTIGLYLSSGPTVETCVPKQQSRLVLQRGLAKVTGNRYSVKEWFLNVHRYIDCQEAFCLVVCTYLVWLVRIYIRTTFPKWAEFMYAESLVPTRLAELRYHTARISIDLHNRVHIWGKRRVPAEMTWAVRDIRRFVFCLTSKN